MRRWGLWAVVGDRQRCFGTGPPPGGGKPRWMLGGGRQAHLTTLPAPEGFCRPQPQTPLLAMGLSPMELTQLRPTGNFAQTQPQAAAVPGAAGLPASRAGARFMAKSPFIP